MKTILLLTAVLFFSSVAFAQSDALPDYPYASYEYQKMAPDNNDPYPWGVLVNKQAATDAMPAIPWNTVANKVPLPPVSAGPNSKYATRIEGPMSPEIIFPNVEFANMNKMLPY